jgi:hypothetical protein
MTTDAGGRNNWTKVSSIPWYQPATLAKPVLAGILCVDRLVNETPYSSNQGELVPNTPTVKFEGAGRNFRCIQTSGEGVRSANSFTNKSKGFEAAGAFHRRGEPVDQFCQSRHLI